MYYLTPKVAQVRNLSVSVVNGAISLTILLIAPLGLFAVIVNTLLIMASTYGTLVGSDRLIAYLLRDRPQDSRRGSDRFGSASSQGMSRRGDMYPERNQDDLER